MIEPAIRFATDGFAASHYLVNLIGDSAAALARFPGTAEVFLPGGRRPEWARRFVRRRFARTLRQIADEGAETMYTGALARTIVADMQANGGLISLEDLAELSASSSGTPCAASIAAHEILSAAPPSSGGTHIVQMLNLLSGFPLGGEGLEFGTTGVRASAGRMLQDCIR